MASTQDNNYRIMKQNNKVGPYVTEYVADTESALPNIDTKDIAPGSACLVLESGNIYILSVNKEWKKI